MCCLVEDHYIFKYQLFILIDNDCTSMQTITMLVLQLWVTMDNDDIISLYVVDSLQICFVYHHCHIDNH